MNKIKKINFATFAPFVGLIALFVFYIVLSLVNDTNLSYGLSNIINQSIIVVAASTGAIFIYAIGSFDISLGASLCFSAIIGAMAYNKTESVFVMFLVCIGVSVFVSLLNSTMASVFHLPVFVTTIAMLSLLNALILVLIGANGTGDIVKVDAKAVSGLDNVFIKMLFLGAYLVISVFVFSFLRQGRDEKFIGGNSVCAKLSGINSVVVTIIAFVMAGIGVGLAAFLEIVYAPTLSRTTASSVGMDVIIAIVFGGMPVSGGARSKIYSACIGAVSMTILSQIMTLLNCNSGVGQIIKAVIFICVVYISISNRKKMLTR